MDTQQLKQVVGPPTSHPLHSLISITSATTTSVPVDGSVAKTIVEVILAEEKRRVARRLVAAGESIE